jgi:hypothetical protein
MPQKKTTKTASPKTKKAVRKTAVTVISDMDPLPQLLEKHPGFNLLQHDFFGKASLKKSVKAAISSLKSEGLFELAKTRQRLMRIWPDHKVAAKLEAKGYDSAARIAATPKWRFQEDVQETLNTDSGLANKIHANALSISEKMKHVYANTHAMVASPHYNATLFGNTDDSLSTYLQGVPSYQTLFGNLDYCKCDECSSIFSPAAYFLDIMRITDEYITPVNPAIPAGMKLQERRPDLFNIKLTCANTNNPVPTIQIINEVMEAKLQSGLQVNTGTAQSATVSNIVLAATASTENNAYSGMLVFISSGTGSGQQRTITAYNGTSKTATVMNRWEVTPDNTSQYVVMKNIYSVMAVSPYPFNEPFNLPLEQSRLYMASIGASLSDVYAALYAPLQWGNVLSATTITIIFATTIQPVTGSYVNRTIKIANGTGMGEERIITAYDAGTKTATINEAWTIIPDSKSQYYISDPAPALRESLGTSIEEVTQLTTPLTTGPTLSPQYGYTNLADIALVSSLTPLVEFMWRTQLTRQQVVALLTQQLDGTELAAGIANSFYINDTGESMPYMQLATNTSGAAPVEIIQNLTIKRLDRLNRFIRLTAATGWSYAATDWVMKACVATEITPAFLSQVSQVKILCNQTKLTPEVICSFWYKMKNIGRVSETKPQDLFNTVYNNPALLKGQNPYTATTYIPFNPLNHPDQQWAITDNTGLNATIRSRLSAALNLNDNDLTETALFVYSQVTPATGADDTMALSYENLSWMYRIAGMAKLSKLGVDAFLVYLSMEFYQDVPNYAQPPYGSFVPTLELTFGVQSKFQWLQKSGFTPYDLQYILTGYASAKFTGPTYNAMAVQQFVQSLAVISEASRIRRESFVFNNISADESAAIFAAMVAAGYIDQYGITLTNNITFAQAAAFLPVSELAFVTDNIDAAASKQVFNLLTTNPAGAGKSFLLNPVTINGVQFATLNENYYAYSSLDFLFVSKGAGQQQQIAAYTGATRTATVNTNFTVIPDTTSWYAVSLNETSGTAQAGSEYAIILDASASGENGAYNGMEVNITAGTGIGQQNKILSYNGTTREAVMANAWITVPDKTSVYNINDIPNSGFATGGTVNTIILDENASTVDGAYNNNQVSITNDPKAELKRGEVRKRLIAVRNNIEHTASLIPQFEKLQNENCLQAIAGFMNTTADMVAVLLPFAASTTDLLRYLEALLAPIPAGMLYSFLPTVTEGSFTSELITEAESKQAYQALVTYSPPIIIPNVVPDFAPQSGTVSSTFNATTPLDFLFTGDPQAVLKRAQVKAVLLISQRAAKVNRLIQSLSRSLLLVTKIALTPDEARFILTEPGCCNISNVEDLTLDNIINISAYKGLIVSFNDTTGALNAYFHIPKQNVLPNEKTNALTKITGWNQAQLDVLITRFWPLDDAANTHSTYGSVTGLLRLKNCFDLSATTGIDVFNLLNVNILATLPLADGNGALITVNWLAYIQIAQALLAASNGKLGEPGFAAADKVIQKTLLTFNRNALLPYLIWQLNASPNTNFIRTTTDLYQYLLLDVEMSACDNSSYIAQAIASVQLYLQRCRMMLETGVVDLSKVGTAWWEWMMAYRVWEANRRIFLYPENYIDPSLYKYQSPAFKKFTDSLQQTNITNQTVTEAYTEYMNEFTLVSNLVQNASYTTNIHDDRSGKNIERLFIFGHTNDEPYTYYYRTYDSKYSWSPWQQMKITIASPIISPIYSFRRLFVFWTEQVTQSGSTIKDNNSIPNSATTSAVKFSFLNDDGTWAPPQTLQENVVVDYMVNYAMDPYVKSILPAIVPSYNPQLTWWQKVYPLYIPQTSFQQPDKYPNTESVAVCFGFGVKTIPGQVIPVPTPPASNIDPVRYQFQYDAWSLLSNLSAVSAPQTGYQSTYVSAQQAIVFDSGLSQQNITPVLLNYRPNDPVPYFPILNRPTSQLGINKTTTGNIILDNYYSDDWAMFPSPNNNAAPQLLLLNNISPNTTNITTIKNIVGSFIFDNGDESFWVTSQEKGIVDIDKTIAANYTYAPFPAGNFYFYISSYIPGITSQQPFNTLQFKFTRLSTRTGRVFSQKLLIGGVNELLTIQSQQTPEYPFSRLNPQPAVIAPATDIMDFDGAYGLYFSEIFFHAPFLVGYMLSANQRFDEARKWYEYIFNPTQPPEVSLPNPNDRFWRYLPFRNMTLPTLIQTLTNPAQIAAYNDEPFSPDAIARLRPSAYAKAIVMKYISNIIAWGDNLFAQDTRESINQATGLYVLASDLLGKRPELINDCPKPKPLNFNEVKQMYNNTTIATGQSQKGTANTIQLATGSSTQTDAYTGMNISITAGTGNGQVNYITAYDGKTLTATVATPWTTVPDTTSAYRIYLDQIPQFFIHLENSAFYDPTAADNYSSGVYNDIPSYFCVPENNELVAYWDVVEDRLFKIRHCMNIQGQERSLALFAPPIDPRLLIAAAASGNTGILTSGQLEVPIPAYRFEVMLERTRNFTSNVMQFGASLLSALERKDAESLSVLQNTQENVLLNMTTIQREQQIMMYTANGSALNESLLSAQARYEYYNTLVSKGLNVGEILNIAGMTTATALNVASGILGTAAAVGYLVPNVGSPFAMTYGGEQIGAALTAGAGVLQVGATIADFVAQLSILIAGYQRRAEEWTFQAKQAQFDTMGLTYQIQSNDVQKKMAEQDLRIHETTLSQNQAIGNFMRDKFTNVELYQWMITRLSTVYFQAYTLAYELARETQRAYQYELNTNQSFINFGYWDNMRKGLLAGEGLMLSLMQMEKSWSDNNTRNLEISKTISLKQLDPNALLQLIETGECMFNLNEKLFDDDYPGHYGRKIKAISISIPAVLGPYQEFHATLTQMTNQVVLRPDINAVNFLLGGTDAETPAADILRTNWNISQVIAVSNGVNDSGLFELNFNDQRYLPFEGTGAVSSWRLSMPVSTNLFNFESISDIIVQVNYTAYNGGTKFRNDVQGLDAMRTRTGSRFFNMAQNFSQQWFTFMNVHPVAMVNQTLLFDIASLQPPHIKNPVLTGFYFELNVPPGKKTQGTVPYITLNLGSGFSDTFNLDKNNSCTGAINNPPPVENILGNAGLSFNLANTPADLKTTSVPVSLNQDVVLNAVLILLWSGENETGK